MAVVFISPKHKQKMFFMAITISLGIFILFSSLWVFLSSPSDKEIHAVFNKPKISINLAILDDEQFKKIEAFEKIPLQFKYIAVDKKNKQFKGLISAFSKEEAEKLIETAGLLVSEIEEVDIGRENPFIPFDSFITSQ